MNTGWGKTSHRFHLEFSSAFSLLSSLISRKNHAQTRRIDRRKLADFEPLIVSMGEKKRRFMLASKVSPRRENRPNYPLPSDLHFFPSLLRGWSWILIGAESISSIRNTFADRGEEKKSKKSYQRGEKKEREKEGTGLARVRLLVPLVFRGKEGRDAYFPISLQTAALSRKKGEKRRGE